MLLTFIIPVRHQDNARDWSLLVRNLKQTIASLDNQTNRNFSVLVVANHGAELPEFPDKVDVVWVDFSPNLIHDKGTATQDDFLDAFRLDKGRRVLEGMKFARDSQYFMIVDDDDFVNRNVVEYVSKNTGEAGWVIEKGYIWDSGGRFLLQHNNLNGVCGTTLIIKTELYQLEENFDNYSTETIKDILGSHRRIKDILKSKGHFLRPLPFRGAIYRVANSVSHSQSEGIFNRYLNPCAPRTFLRSIPKLRLLTNAVSQTFFGRG